MSKISYKLFGLNKEDTLKNKRMIINLYNHDVYFIFCHIGDSNFTKCENTKKILLEDLEN